MSRFVLQGDDLGMSMLIDVNTELYPLAEGQRLKCMIASTLNLDGAPSEEEFDATLLDGTRCACVSLR